MRGGPSSFTRVLALDNRKLINQSKASWTLLRSEALRCAQSFRAAARMAPNRTALIYRGFMGKVFIITIAVLVTSPAAVAEQRNKAAPVKPDKSYEACLKRETKLINARTAVFICNKPGNW